MPGSLARERRAPSWSGGSKAALHPCSQVRLASRAAEDDAHRAQACIASLFTKYFRHPLSHLLPSTTWKQSHTLDSSNREGSSGPECIRDTFRLTRASGQSPPSVPQHGRLTHQPQSTQALGLRFQDSPKIIKNQTPKHLWSENTYWLPNTENKGQIRNEWMFIYMTTKCNVMSTSLIDPQSTH